jgi:LppX_LprAFG lipoprotein
MRRAWHRPFIVLTTLVVALFALSLYGCGSASQNVDPQAVLAASSTKMQQIKGFHFVYEVHKPANTKPGSGLDIARITGDVNSDGNMQAAIDVTQGGIPLTLEFVQVGDTQYLKLGQWQTIPIESSPVGKLSLGAGTIQILQRITGAKYVGEDTKGGVKCYHITGMVAAAEVKAIAGAVDTTDTFPTDIWIGVADSYVYEVDIHGAASPGEPKATWRSVVLSNHDVYVPIKAPI